MQAGTTLIVFFGKDIRPHQFHLCLEDLHRSLQALAAAPRLARSRCRRAVACPEPRRLAHDGVGPEVARDARTLQVDTLALAPVRVPGLLLAPRAAVPHLVARVAVSTLPRFLSPVGGAGEVATDVLVSDVELPVPHRLRDQLA